MLNSHDIDLPETDNLPAVAVDSLNGSLDEITKRYEASVLSRLYRDYPSTRKLAKRLEVSHTAIANKLREYGLNQKKSRIMNKFLTLGFYSSASLGRAMGRSQHIHKY